MGPAESKLRHCLTARTRRWAVSEFFYSAIDRPWFLRNELQVPRLSPSSLGFENFTDCKTLRPLLPTRRAAGDLQQSEL